MTRILVTTLLLHINDATASLLMEGLIIRSFGASIG